MTGRVEHRDASDTIHDAARRGSLRAVTTCVERDPTSVHALDRHRWLPLFHAALRRRESVVRYLLEHGSDVGAREGLALHLAAEVPDNRSVIAMLLQHGALEHHARPTGEPQRQLLTAIFLGDAIAVDQKLRADPSLVRSSDGRGYTPLHRAAQHGDLRIMTALIAHGADVNATTARGDSVLYCVAGHGHLDGVSLLLAKIGRAHV